MPGRHPRILVTNTTNHHENTIGEADGPSHYRVILCDIDDDARRSRRERQLRDGAERSRASTGDCFQVDETEVKGSRAR